MPYVLLLNADYTPTKVIRWERAVELVLDNKAVEVAAWPGRFVRSACLALPWPAVIALRRFTQPRGRVRFCGRNVAARDNYTCAYCGWAPRLADGRPDRDQLTLDHVIPRAQAREGRVYLPWAKRWANVTCWENAVTACRACNARKADRTPSQAGMALRIFPRLPTPADALRMNLARIGEVPELWEPYLPAGVAAAVEAVGVRRVASS